MYFGYAYVEQADEMKISESLEREKKKFISSIKDEYTFGEKPPKTNNSSLYTEISRPDIFSKSD